MTSRIILLDGVNSKYAVNLTTSAPLTQMIVPRLIIAYHTDRLEHKVAPRVVCGAVLTPNPVETTFEGIRDAYEWIKDLLKDHDRRAAFIEEVLDFCEEYDNANSAIYEIMRIDLIGLGLRGPQQRMLRLTRDFGQSEFTFEYTK